MGDGVPLTKLNINYDSLNNRENSLIILKSDVCITYSVHIVCIKNNQIQLNFLHSSPNDINLQKN